MCIKTRVEEVVARLAGNVASRALERIELTTWEKRVETHRKRIELLTDRINMDRESISDCLSVQEYKSILHNLGHESFILERV